MLTYQDYLRAVQDPGLGGTAGFDEAAWNALPDADKWKNAGNRLVLRPDDPRYAQFAPRLGGEAGRNVEIRGGDPNTMRGYMVDPSRMVSGNGWYGYKEDNETPEYQHLDDENTDWKTLIAMAALPIAAGAATGAFAGGAAGGAGTGAAAGAGAGGGGLDAVAAAEWFGGAGAANAPSAGLFGGAGAGAAGAAGAGGMDAISAAEWFGGPGAASNPSPGLFGSAEGAAGAAAGGSSQGLLGQGQDLLGRAGNWAMNNPLRALSLANTGIGLLNRGGSNGGGSGGGGGKSGGGTGLGGPPAKTERPQWNPNPFLQAQLQRGGYL
jgi:hypothetical protein